MAVALGQGGCPAMILHLYIARHFLRALVIVTAVFVAILLPVDIGEHLISIGATQGLGPVIELALLNLPGSLYNMIPLFVLLASLLLFLGLSRTSELVVVRASGRSALRAIAAPAIVAVLVGTAVVAVLNPIVAITKQTYDTRTVQYRGGEVRTVSVTPEGLWMRQGTTVEQTVIRAGSSNADGTHLFDVSFFQFGPGNLITARVNAAEARLIDGAWDLRDVRRWPLDQTQNPEATVERYETLTLSSTLTRQQIQDSFGMSDRVPIFELPKLIAQLRQAGIAALQHRVWFQMELSAPLLLAAMVLIGSSVVVQHDRMGRTGVKVLIAILLGFVLFFIRSFAQVLGENGQLAIVFVAWVPPLSAILLGIGLILYQEDG
ncbi:MAG: hypothetical protein RLZZ491_1842 [Pseudomonadota bacterium]